MAKQPDIETDEEQTQQPVYEPFPMYHIRLLHGYDCFFNTKVVPTGGDVDIVKRNRNVEHTHIGEFDAVEAALLETYYEQSRQKRFSTALNKVRSLDYQQRYVEGIQIKDEFVLYPGLTVVLGQSGKGKTKIVTQDIYAGLARAGYPVTFISFTEPDLPLCK